MDTLSIAFVALFCILGGLIAYGADLTGRAIGKRRLTFLRLRPKHTAALMTAIAGVLLPFFTVLILYSLSSDVRMWLNEGRQAAAERDKRIAELNATRKVLDSTRREVNQLGRRQEIEAARLRAAQQQVSSLRTDSARLKADALQLRSQVRVATLEVGRRRAELASLRASYTGLRTNNAQFTKENQLLGTQNITLSQQLVGREERLRLLEGNITSLQEQEKRLNQELQTAKDSFEAERQRLGREIDDARQKLEAARMEVNKAEGEILRLRQLESTMTQGLNANLRITRTLRLIYQSGEEVARIQVSPKLDQSSASKALLALVEAAKQAAQGRGAGTAGGTAPAGLIDLPLERGTLTAKEQSDQVVKAITDVDDQSVIVAYAFWNSFDTESVPLKLAAFRNPVVYRAGQIIAETRIRGDQPESAILEDITRFLRDNVSHAARRDRMIPAAGREEQFGRVTSEEMLSLVRQVRGANRTVRFIAYAPEDIRAADTLNLGFRIR